MAYGPNELVSTGSVIGPRLRVDARHIEPKTFTNSGVATTLPLLTPVAFNTATGFYTPWSQATTGEINRITAAATVATAGNFTLTVNGVVTGNIAFNANAAAIKQAIVVAGIANPNEVSVVDAGGGIAANNGTATITWLGDMANRNITITIDTSGLTGNAHVLSTVQGGIDGGAQIRGFVWPDVGVLEEEAESLVNILTEGSVEYADIPLPAGTTADQLKAALRDGPREFGLVIKGLDAVR